MTKKQVLTLARKTYGPRAELHTNPKALTATEKHERHEANRLRTARIKEIDERLKAIGDYRKPLYLAAEFVCDVDAQEPSLSQLRAAFAVAKEAESLRAEKVDLDRENRRISTHSSRYEILTNEGWCCTFCVGADTLESLAEKMRQKASVAVDAG